MSQATNPFTQAASQGYGNFEATLDEDEQEENNVVDDNEEEPEGPESPEPENEQETNEYGFTQTQERSYPEGIASPDEEDDAGPSSPIAEDENDSNDQEEETNRKQSQSHSQLRRVQIMNDSDNEDEPQSLSSSVVSKEKNRNFLKQFTMKNESTQKKRRTEEHHREKKSKRARQTSEDNADAEEEQDNVEATSDVDDLVDDIFGKNNNDDEVDDQEEAAAELADLKDDAVQEEGDEDVEQQEQTMDDDDDDDDDDDELAHSSSRTNESKSKGPSSYDIDLLAEKLTEKRRGNRYRKGKHGDADLSGPDADKLVGQLIEQMKIATEEDRIYNKSRQPAVAKLLLLPTIEQYLCRADLLEIFLENGVLTVFKDWLSPLPDKSLPNIKIRQAIINVLPQFRFDDNIDPLRDSGIGKALMYLYKHPRETKDNKIKLIRIIHDWARPIFNLNTDYKLLTPQDRQQRDADQASLKRQTSSTGKRKNRSADVDLPFVDKRHDDDDDDDCPRARVPRPSNKDYVVRPISKIECPDRKEEGKKKTVSRLDEIKRRQQDRKRLARPMPIVKLSIEGNKMHL